MLRMTFTITSLSLMLSGCSFNKMFLYPTKLSREVKQLNGYDPELGVNYKAIITGNNFQPYFLSATGDTLITGYTIESVVFQSKNGNILNGWFIKPIKTKADITLFHMHGNAGCLFSQLPAISPMVKQNFQVFMFDYSGFGFSEGKATKDNVLTDAYSAFDYLKNRDDVRTTRLVIYGQSLGGHASAVLAADKQSEIDGLVIEGAFSSHKDIAAHSTKKMMGMSSIGRILVKQSYCGKKSIADLHKPVLIIHSIDDAVIPFFMGQEMYKCANEPKEFFGINHEHICGPLYYSVQISDRIRSVLDSTRISR